jgi:hypothetical protein
MKQRFFGAKRLLLEDEKSIADVGLLTLLFTLS